MAGLRGWRPRVSQRKEQDRISAEENKALFRRLFEAINEGDWAAIDDVLAADLYFDVPAAPKLHTREDFRRGMMFDRVSFPPAQWTIDEIVADGDDVAVWMTFRGVHSAVVRGMPPTGSEIAAANVCFARFADGKIVEARWLHDQTQVLVKIRAIPPPTQPEV